MRTQLLLAALTAACLSRPAHADPQFTLQQITLPGATSVDATAIGNSGLIVGSETDANGEHGFTLQGATLTVLPGTVPYCSSAATVYPTAVNASGKVVGAAVCGQSAVTFDFENGAYNANAAFNLGTKDRFVVMNNNGSTAMNLPNRVGWYIPVRCNWFDSDYGRCKKVFRTSHQGLEVRSINEGDYLAGTIYKNCGTAGHCVWLGRSGARNESAAIYPSGAATASGGYVNDSRQVAGVYAPSIGGNYSGFVYQNGQYTIFDVPGTAYTMNVYGINDSGRVVGIFSASEGAPQQGFLYNGTTVSPFGSFPAGDTVKAAINKNGVIVVSDTSASGSVSYRVRCTGSGC